MKEDLTLSSGSGWSFPSFTFFNSNALSKIFTISYWKFTLKTWLSKVVYSRHIGLSPSSYSLVLFSQIWHRGLTLHPFDHCEDTGYRFDLNWLVGRKANRIKQDNNQKETWKSFLGTQWNCEWREIFYWILSILKMLRCWGCGASGSSLRKLLQKVGSTARQVRMFISQCVRILYAVFLDIAYIRRTWNKVFVSVFEHNLRLCQAGSMQLDSKLCTCRELKT